MKVFDQLRHTRGKHGGGQRREQGKDGKHGDVAPFLLVGPVHRVLGIIWRVPVYDIGVGWVGGVALVGDGFHGRRFLHIAIDVEGRASIGGIGGRQRSVVLFVVDGFAVARSV